MYFLILFGCLGLGAVGFFVAKRSEGIGQSIMILSALGCAGLIGWQAFSSVGGGAAPRIHRGQAAVAYTVAHQFLGMETRRTGKVVLLFPPDSEAPTAALDSFFEGIARVLARFPSIEVVEAKVEFSESDGASLESFQNALEGGSEVLAYVSWVGFPDGAEAASVFEDPASRPSLYVYDPRGGTNWLAQVKSGIIRAGVIERAATGAAEATAMGPRTPNVIFSESFQMVTAANVSNIGGGH